jgi:hypothetical protein
MLIRHYDYTTRPTFSTDETKLSTVPEFIDPVFTKTSPKRSFWACFRENWVYKFGHSTLLNALLTVSMKWCRRPTFYLHFTMLETLPSLFNLKKVKLTVFLRFSLNNSCVLNAKLIIKCIVSVLPCVTEHAVHVLQKIKKLMSIHEGWRGGGDGFFLPTFWPSWQFNLAVLSQ